MRKTAWILLAVFALVMAATAWAAPEVKKVTGSVSMICPQHKAIKVKSGDNELMLWVNQSCPKKDELTKQIAGLKVDQKITASYFECTKSKKLYLTGIEA